MWSVVAVFFAISSAQAEDVLTGDTRLSCEAIMCLSSGVKPDECEPSLRRYFDIREKKLSDTIEKRVDFLKKCPASDDNPQMTQLIAALASGAGRCDAVSLNKETRKNYRVDNEESISIISNTLPSYCNDYLNNDLVSYGDVMPKYVGEPEKGGYWTEAGNYENALTEYNALIAKQEAARQEADAYNGR